jgi:AmmeMemoRadiSam system protein B
MIRTPVVANQFYPGDPQLLRQTLEELIPDKPKEKKKALAVISPHAGYIYSGSVAGETFAHVEIPDDIVILGPNHSGRGARIAMMSDGEWQMPLGNIHLNADLGNFLAQSTLIEQDHIAHSYEHSLEVQVPFIQYLKKSVTILPFVVSHIPFSDCVAAGKEIAAAIRKYNKPVLMVASTDMTHYESRKSASHKDHLAIDHILSLNPEGLYNTVVGQRISMCGIMPTTIVLIAALELGATKAKLIKYTDSGETSGDTQQVVGYAGCVVS